MRFTQLKGAVPILFQARKVGSLGVITLLLAGACGREPTAPLSPDIMGHADVGTTIASYLIDTGPGGTSSIGSSAMFSAGSTTCSPQPACAANLQYLGGKFTLANEADIESVEGWMSIAVGGSLAVHIRPDEVPTTGASVPGSTSLHSVTYTVTPQVYGWKVFSSFTVNLPAGTYWLTFEPVANSGFNGGMTGTAAAPLADYAFFNEGNNRWVAFSLFNQNPALGFRVFGTEASAPPPPPSPEGMIADLRIVISDLGLPKGMANSLDSKLRAALRALDEGQTARACTSLQDLINHANAQSGKKLAASDAANIVAATVGIRTELGC